jgi:hypothetical protein
LSPNSAQIAINTTRNSSYGAGSLMTKPGKKHPEGDAASDAIIDIAARCG